MDSLLQSLQWEVARFARGGAEELGPLPVLEGASTQNSPGSNDGCHIRVVVKVGCAADWRQLKFGHAPSYGLGAEALESYYGLIE
jgi:hypothetical protein